MTESWYYNPGDHYVLEDISGFKRRMSKCRTIPGGQTGNAIVDRSRWEPQQPQDFVRGVPDDQTTTPLRPRQMNNFTVVGSYVTDAAEIGATAITIAASTGMSVNDSVQVMLDSGENFTTTISAIAGLVLTLAAGLPATVGKLAVENAVLDLTAAGW